MLHVAQFSYLPQDQNYLIANYYSLENYLIVYFDASYLIVHFDTQYCFIPAQIYGDFWVRNFQNRGCRFTVFVEHSQNLSIRADTCGYCFINIISKGLHVVLRRCTLSSTECCSYNVPIQYEVVEIEK